MQASNDGWTGTLADLSFFDESSYNEYLMLHQRLGIDYNALLEAKDDGLVSDSEFTAKSAVLRELGILAHAAYLAEMPAIVWSQP